MKFVVHEFRAGDRSRFYLRLEKDGALKSWALPKGLPEAGGRQHLALKVADGDLSLAEFEGDIKKGKFGPGGISVWDKGAYICREWGETKIIVTLAGERIKESFALIRFEKAGDRGWLLGQTKIPSPPLKPIPEVRKAPWPKKRRPLSQNAFIYKKRRTLKFRFPKLKKSSFRTGYSKKDWKLLIILFIVAFILLGLAIFSIALLTF